MQLFQHHPKTQGRPHPSLFIAMHSNSHTKEGLYLWTSEQVNWQRSSEKFQRHTKGNKH